MTNLPDMRPCPSDDAGLTAQQTANNSGLRYVGDGMAGIHRERARGGFVYKDAHGKTIRDAAVMARIKALAIPPAWDHVWICPWANGHLQATGRDARRRKQYRYHARWRAVRDATKFQRMINFALALPRIRQRLDNDLHQPRLCRRKVLATVIYLLQATLIRIGNDEYARNNQSFGLTTLRNRHVHIDGAEIKFRFRGKSGVRHAIKLRDPYLVRILKKLLDLPGRDLFQFVDHDGVTHSIHSGDVNDYLRDISGHDYTAKDFRTWAGTLLAALALDELRQFDSQAQAKKNIAQAIERAAKKLGNTPSICRKSYVHPDIIAAYLEGVTVSTLKAPSRQQRQHALPALTHEEAAVLTLLQHRLQQTLKAERKPP